MDQKLCHYVSVMKLKLITTSAILAFAFTANLYAQENADPYAKGETVKESVRAARPALSSKVAVRGKSKIPTTFTIMYELFSLPMSEAAELMRSGKKDEEIYLHLTKKAKQERLTVMRTRSGEKSSSESISEFIYPTEFGAPSIPNTLGVQIAPADKKGTEQKETPQLEKLSQAPSINDLNGVSVPAVPTAFETRNTGVSVEVELIFSPQVGVCDLRIAPEYVTLSGLNTWGQGVSKCSMPEFETQRLTTAVTCKLEKPILLGTMNRSPFSKLGLPDRVWFATVTVKPVTP